MSKLGVVLALCEAAIFHADDAIRNLDRSPIGHYRVPTYMRGERYSSVSWPP